MEISINLTATWIIIIISLQLSFMSTLSMTISSSSAPQNNHLRAHKQINRINSASLVTHRNNTRHEPTKAEEDFERWVERMRISSSSDHVTTGDSRQQKWSSFMSPMYNDPGTVFYVDAHGFADYTNIQDAVDQVPDHNSGRITILIRAGVYVEKVVIPTNKPYLTLQGEGRDKTFITWHDNAASSGTLNSATVIVRSDHFIARDITFKGNSGDDHIIEADATPTYGRVSSWLNMKYHKHILSATLAKSTNFNWAFQNSVGPPTPTRTGMQAAAFRISGDKAFLYMCQFYGYQDTLYDHLGRHYYLRCLIEGSVDFIFGIARSLFERCWLYSNADSYSGALVAQGKYFPDNNPIPSGFSFLRCRISGSGQPFLGRAWGEYSTVVYSYCFMDVDINPAGWYDWGLTDRDQTVFFGQYRCTGRGANTSDRVKWSRELTDQEASPFLGIGFINGPW